MAAEYFETLLQRQHLRIERIVSTGQMTPEDSWYDQEWDEWVLVVRGSATLVFADTPQAVALQAGDYVLIPAHRRHRVSWTDPEQETLWLAVHFKP